MAKYEIEVDDETALRWSHDSYSVIGASSTINPERVAAAIGELVKRYGTFPKIVGPKHQRALAMLRERAQQQALSIAKPGEDAWNIASMADSLVAYLTESE